MGLLAGSITQGQAVTLVLLCIFLFIFVLIDVCLLFSLRRGNRRLENDNLKDRVEDTEDTEKE